MPDEVKLEPCPFCGCAMKFGKHDWFIHAEHNMGCIIGYEAFPPADVGNWNTRAAIEATRPTAATDDVVKELVEAKERVRELEDLLFRYGDRVRMARAEPSSLQFSIDEAMANASERARTGVTLNG